MSRFRHEIERIPLLASPPLQFRRSFRQELGPIHNHSDRCVRAVSLGNGMPALGTKCANLGDAVPALGTRLPKQGRPCPKLGKDMPPFGTSRPKLGISVPCSGTSLPKEGTTRANFGRAVPSLGRATTYLSNQQGEIVKSDKSPSQIRNFEIADWTRLSEVQSEISDLGFEMQDSSDFTIPSHRCLVSQVC